MTQPMMTASTLKNLMPEARFVHISQDFEIQRVMSDSRRVEEGDLFIALHGEKYDGHDYLDDVRAKGASICLIHDEAYLPSDFPAIIVDDSLMGMQTLAKAWRLSQSQLKHLVVVTGSNGKTTVKGMIASIFNQALGEEHVLATTGNLNNEIGLPLTLLELRDDHQLAVVELGMNHPGETKVLADLAVANIALINNAQREHQEFMTSVEMVAKEHALAIQALPLDGTAIFPADSEYVDEWLNAAGDRKVMTFAWQNFASVNGDWISREEQHLKIETPIGSFEVRLNILGEHNAKNALAATTVALAAGLDLGAIQRGLESFSPVNGRMQQHRLKGVTVIDDTYNANPDSVKAAIDVLASMNSSAWLVLGDMGEVGEQGPEFHQEVGQYAAQKGIQKLFAIGELSRQAVLAYSAGHPNLSGKHYEDLQSLISDLKKSLSDAAVNHQPVVLVKGSRFMRMERIVKSLVEESR